MNVLKKAAASTAAKKNKQHNKPYLKAVSLSSLKEQIGQLLLNTQAQSIQPNQWHIFELKLRQYIEHKLCEVK